MKSLAKKCSAGLMLIAASATASGERIGVVTYNQYLGADLAPVLIAADNNAFNNALIGVLTQIAKSNIPARMAAQAKIIGKRNPHVVALQEAWSLTCKDFDQNPATGCEDPLIANAFHDNLELTLAALNKKKLNYKTVAVVKNLDLSLVDLSPASSGIPFNIKGVDAFLIAIDRDAILVRSDVEASTVAFPDALCPHRSADGCNYQVVAEANTPAGPLPVQRSFVAIDATVANLDYRVFNTHLEVKGEDVFQPAFTFYQAMQANELVSLIAATQTNDRYSILLGDMNSSPLQKDQTSNSGDIITPYHQFTAAGYQDAWAAKPKRIPGLSCCQSGDLANRRSRLYERIDMIFLIDQPVKLTGVKVAGNKVSDKTKPARTGLWPSDHASVTAKLQY